MNQFIVNGIRGLST